MKEKAAWSGLRRFATMAGDVFLFNISVLIAFYLKFGHVIPDRNFYTYEKSAVYISIVFLVVNFLLGVYVFYNRRVSDIIFTTVLGQIITIAALIMITFIGRLFAFPRMVLVYSFIVSVIVLCIWRVMVFFVYLRFTSNQRVVVLANETELPAIVQNFNSAKNNKHKVTHVITANFVQNAHKVINDVDIFFISRRVCQMMIAGKSLI